MSLHRFSSKCQLQTSSENEHPQDDKNQPLQKVSGVASRVISRLLLWRPSKSAANLKTMSLVDLKSQQCASMSVEHELSDKTASFLELPRRQSSDSINIPLKKCVSDRLPVRRVPSSRRRHFSSGDDDHAKCTPPTPSAAEWRKRQKQCANCAQVFFKSMPDLLAADMTAYCSLDCKTTHGYMRSVHVAVDSHLSSLVDAWVDDGSADSSPSSASTCTSLQEVAN